MDSFMQALDASSAGCRRRPRRIVNWGITGKALALRTPCIRMPQGCNWRALIWLVSVALRPSGQGYGGQISTTWRSSRKPTRHVVPSPGSMLAVRWLIRKMVPTTVLSYLSLKSAFSPQRKSVRPGWGAAGGSMAA